MNYTDRPTCIRQARYIRNRHRPLSAPRCTPLLVGDHSWPEPLIVRCRLMVGGESPVTGGDHRGTEPGAPDLSAEALAARLFTSALGHWTFCTRTPCTALRTSRRQSVRSRHRLAISDSLWDRPIESSADHVVRPHHVVVLVLNDVAVVDIPLRRLYVRWQFKLCPDDGEVARVGPDGVLESPL
jgi:hypothetical protein